MVTMILTAALTRWKFSEGTFCNKAIDRPRVKRSGAKHWSQTDRLNIPKTPSLQTSLPAVADTYSLYVRGAHCAKKKPNVFILHCYHASNNPKVECMIVTWIPKLRPSDPAFHHFTSPCDAEFSTAVQSVSERARGQSPYIHESHESSYADILHDSMTAFP